MTGTSLRPVRENGVMGARIELTSSQGYWALVDFLLATLPITFLWRLKLDLKQRVLLSVLLGLGIL